MSSFTELLTKVETKAIDKMREIITTTDPTVSESIGKIMSQEGCYIYKQEGVFKYGLAKTKNHFSFHSMVMYANAEIREIISTSDAKLKLQKGCVNFTHVEDFPIKLFMKVMKQSATTDFSPILVHYKNKEKK